MTFIQLIHILHSIGGGVVAFFFGYGVANFINKCERWRSK